jgi:AcrR family transcriptional regulator
LHRRNEYSFRAPSDSTPKRDAILRAALELFSERTFEGTPVPVIAARAGVGAGTLYRYFPTKRALVNVIYRDCKLEMGRRLEQARPTEASIGEEFVSMWRQLWEFARDLPEAFRFVEMHHHSDYLDASSRAATQSASVQLRSFILRGQKAGAIRAEPPEVLIAMVFGAFVGLVREEAEGRLHFDEEALQASARVAWALLCD